VCPAHAARYVARVAAAPRACALFHFDLSNASRVVDET